MSRFDSYLATIGSSVTRERVRATLGKLLRTTAGTETEAALVERYVGLGCATLKFYSDTGKKRDGMRLPKKPAWSIWGGRFRLRDHAHGRALRELPPRGEVRHHRDRGAGDAGVRA